MKNLILFSATVFLLSCGSPLPTLDRHSPAPTPYPVPTITSPTYASCRYNYIGSTSELPDHNCTPGVVSSKVTEDNRFQTICRSGYTKTIRPPVSYTNKLKLQQLIAYGDAQRLFDAQSIAYKFEEDHLVALEIGGSPTDPLNLWPEVRGSTNADLKDKVENATHEQICLGKLPLNDAQQKMALNWYQLGQDLGVIK